MPTVCTLSSYPMRRVGDVKENYADISKARDVLNWEPHVGLETGLRNTYEWFSNLASFGAL